MGRRLAVRGLVGRRTVRPPVAVNHYKGLAIIETFDQSISQSVVGHFGALSAGKSTY